MDVFFLISYSENSRFHSGIVIYSNYTSIVLPKRTLLIHKLEDDHHIAEILEHAGKNFKDGDLVPKSSEHTNAPEPTPEQKIKYITFSRDTVDYTVTSIGHPIGLRTKYNKSSLQKYTIHLRKPQDPLLKQKYKRALKQHDTLDMIQDAMKLGLVSYAEILGHGMGHIYRGSSTLDIGKGFVGGLGSSQPSWTGLSGDKA